MEMEDRLNADKEKMDSVRIAFFKEVEKRANAMRDKEGWLDWDDGSLKNDLKRRLIDNAARGAYTDDPASLLDASIIAMFLWFQGLPAWPFHDTQDQ